MDTIRVDDLEVVNSADFLPDAAKHFTYVPEVAKTLLSNAKAMLPKIEEMLYSAPAFIQAVKARIPEETLQVVFTDEQRRELAKGSLKLMTKKDGSLMANLLNPKTNKIASTLSLERVKVSPEISQTLTNYATQMQMAQIAEQIQLIQVAVEEVRQGQEFDRLATAYSCQQKLLQAIKIKNPELKATALLQIALDAEDSRNLLMLSQSANLKFLKEQPEHFWNKVTSAARPKKVELRINEIRESLCAVNMVSLTEAIAYLEMGESEAAQQSLQYYAGYLQKAYLEADGFLERLDSMDPSPEEYWTKTLPDIEKKIQALPFVAEQKLLGVAK